MKNADLPAAFKSMLKNLQPTVLEYVDTAEDLAKHALVGIGVEDAKIIADTLEQLLQDAPDRHQLADMWENSPAGITISDGEGVFQFLSRVRSALAMPPYNLESPK